MATGVAAAFDVVSREPDHEPAIAEDEPARLAEASVGFDALSMRFLELGLALATFLTAILLGSAR